MVELVTDTIPTYISFCIIILYLVLGHVILIQIRLCYGVVVWKRIQHTHVVVYLESLSWYIWINSSISAIIAILWKHTVMKEMGFDYQCAGTQSLAAFILCIARDYDKAYQKPMCVEGDIKQESIPLGE